MDNRFLLGLTLLSLSAAGLGLRQSSERRKDAIERIAATNFSVEEESGDSSSGAQRVKPESNPNCREWKNEACVACAIDSTMNISVRNKTKTPVLVCRDMKPGPAKVVMTTHAEPLISGVWEVEFGLGYQTSARNECPHQFIASNNPPLKKAYEVGPITMDTEIPADGMIQTLTCVGLSSARVGAEGKETGASLKVFTLRVASE